MKARLIWLSLICCAFLCSLSLMAADASQDEPVTPAYTQSMVIPAQALALPSGDVFVKFAKSPVVSMPRFTMFFGERLANDTVPVLFRPYHRTAYFAFHYSDEAG